MPEGDTEFQVPAGHKLVTETDLKILQEVYKLKAELFDHPKHGMAVKRAIKELHPEYRIPELDILDPVLAPINERQEAIAAENKKLREEMEADRQTRADERAVEKLTKDLSGAQSRYRLTDEGMAEVRKIMSERNIHDPHAAAALVASEIEPAKVVNGTNFGPADLNVLGMDGKAEDDSTKRLHDNPVRWQDEEIGRIMHEFEQDAA